MQLAWQERLGQFTGTLSHTIHQIGPNTRPLLQKVQSIYETGITSFRTRANAPFSYTSVQSNINCLQTLFALQDKFHLTDLDSTTAKKIAKKVSIPIYRDTQIGTETVQQGVISEIEDIRESLTPFHTFDIISRFARLQSQSHTIEPMQGLILQLFPTGEVISMRDEYIHFDTSEDTKKCELVRELCLYKPITYQKDNNLYRGGEFTISYIPLTSRRNHNQIATKTFSFALFH